MKTNRDKPAGVPTRSRFDARFDERLESDARLLRRIEQARRTLRAGRGIRLEDVDLEIGRS